MRVFLTGGSGFIGGAIARHLTPDHQVWAMARSDAAAAAVGAHGAQPVACDLGSVRPEHLSGSDAVIHCAARVSDWAPPGEFESVNVDGTKRLLAVAAAAGVRRFLHMSSDSALFAGRSLVDVDETTPYPKHSPYRYADAKRRAEQAVRAADAPGFETVCLRPVLVWGPGDRTVLPELVAMIDRRAFVWVDGGRHRVSTTHIDNLVHGTQLALERGRAGSVYFLTDGPAVETRSFLSEYVATAGREPGSLSLPGPVVRAIGRVAEWTWARLRPGLPPPLSREAAAILASDIAVSSELASRELGYAPVVSRAEAMAALADGTGRGR